MALYQIEYDVKQINQLILADEGKGFGDFSNVGKFVSVEEGAKHIKSSSRARVILKKMNLGKYVFDSDKTQKLRSSLPDSMTGIVLKRKFPKEEGELYYSEYMYSIWLKCIKEEVGGEEKYELDLDFHPKLIDWEGKEDKISKNSKINVTSTPIFLIEGGEGGEGGEEGEEGEEGGEGGKGGESREGTSGFVFLGVVGIILLIAIMAIAGIYC